MFKGLETFLNKNYNKWNAANIFGAAGIYILVGKLGVLLSLPTSYASAAWPLSGVALAMVLLGGDRLWPGIWLGSFLLGVCHYFLNHAAEPFNSFLATAAFIGCGAALQTIVGARLIRRYIALPTTLERGRDIVKLFASGAISCLIGSALGISVLYLQHSMPADQYLFAWFNWWAGDVIGVLIFTPLILLLCQNNPDISKQRKILVSAPLAIVFACLVCAFAAVNHWEYERQKLGFEKQAELAEPQLAGELDDYNDAMYGLESFYQNAKPMNPEKFKSFVEYMFDRYPGVLSVVWVSRVSDGERAAYEAGMRKENPEQFQIREQVDGHQFINAAKRDEYFPITYIESKQKHANLGGYDMASEPERLDILQKARDSGEVMLANRLTVNTDNHNIKYKHPDVVLIKPVYEGTPATIADRRTALRGFLISTIAIDQIMNPISGVFNSVGVDMTVCANAPDKSPKLLYSTIPGSACTDTLPLQSAQDNLYWNRDLNINGWHWHLKLLSNKKYMASQPAWASWFVLLGGLMVTGMLGAVSLLMTGRADLVARLVKENISEIEAAQKALQESNRLNNAILSSARHMIVAVDHNGKIMVFNREAERALQYRAVDIIGKFTPVIWHDPGEIAARARQLSEELGGRPVSEQEVFTIKVLLNGSEETEWQFIRKDGTSFPGHLVLSPLRDNMGDVVGFLGIIHDITEERRQKAELKASEETFRVALEYAAIGMAIVSLDGKWLRVNAALCGLLGYQADELGGLDFQTITHPDDLGTDLQNIQKLLAGDIQSYEMEKRFFHKSGRIVWTILSVSLARNADGSPRYFIKQIQDITERKQIDRMKSEFISTVSHELRTPLTSIRGALGLVAAGSAGALPETVLELITIAYNNSGRLVKIINDILDIEKIESGKLQIHLKPVDSLYILRQALEASQSYAEKFQLRFELESAPVGMEVMADPDRMMQIMANLLSNAAKFSPAHSIVQVGATLNGSFMRFYVTDYGVGIPPEFCETIFEKFVQADNSDSRNFEGTGLGLSITKSLVEAMHGNISFKTDLGKGSTFYFDLPLVQNHAAASPLMSCISDHSRILVCEDDPDIARLLDLMLEQYGFQVDIAPTLKSAEEKLRQNHYSAITLDMKMPDGEGADFAREIKNNPAFSHIPVIALSGKSDEVRAQMKESAHAVEEWLTKPFNNNELLNALQRVIAEKFSGLPFILHVEDDRDLTQVISESLKQQAYVVGAGNLREAHAYLKQRNFDLLIVDPILPDGSGLSLLDDLHEKLGYDLPVLVLSADEVNDDVRNKVRAALVKSLMSEQQIMRTILSFLSSHPSQKAMS